MYLGKNIKQVHQFGNAEKVIFSQHVSMGSKADAVGRRSAYYS
jgi:hypothetical protein